MKAVFLIWQLLPVILAVCLVLWVLWRWLKKSDEPGALITRWGISLVLAILVFWVAVRAQDEISKIFAVLVGGVCGLAYAAIWGPSFCAFVARQFTNLYDGGDTELEPRPFYSVAEAKRKQGKYSEAIAEIRTQLEKFPEDFRGWMMVAEIQAENMNDLSGAQETIDQILSQEGHSPKNTAFALSRLADWRLRFGQDREAARSALERIVQLLPDTEQAQFALQRLAHLMPQEMLAEKQEPHRVQLHHHGENLGLREDFKGLGPKPEENPSTVAAAWVKHLEQHPQDFEARENLALIYADHFRRLDLASDQLEQLIAVPHQPPKQVTHWLNLLADIQIRLSGETSQARKTLERIVDRFPKTAAAGNAQNRIAYLNLELKGRRTDQPLKLGTYEQNIGLKGTPH